MPAVLMRRAAFIVALASLAAGCAAASTERRQPRHAAVDGVYRATTSARVTLVLAGRRFAFTREDEQGCAWAYGGLAVKGRRMEWRIVDAGGSPGAATGMATDIYAFQWSRYRDILTLTTVRGAPGPYLAAKPWRRIAGSLSVASLSRRCPPPSTALAPSGVENVTPTGSTMGFSGDFAKTGPTTWTGRGTSKELGPGRMTIEGDVALRDLTRSRLTFTLRFAAGILRGCAINTIIRRPHARYVWDGSGQITGASPRLRRYLGLSGGLGGFTMTYARDRMHGGFGSFPAGVNERPPPGPDVVC
jgi:hypothetical protein